jgi:trigger factor
MDAAKVTLEEVTASRKRLQFEIAAPDVQAEIDRAFSVVGQQARLPGFRPGKAPRRVLERMFGEQVRREVLGRLIEHSFVHAVQEHQLAVVGSPEIDADVLSPGEALRFSATVDVRPVIALGEMNDLEAQRPIVAVRDEDVEEVLGSLRDSVAQLRPVDDRNIVENGDVVTLNLTSRVDGAEPVTRENVMVEAGGGTFPMALERQLVGQNRGSRSSLQVTYPDDYGNPSLAGKTAEFDVEVLDLRQKELPPLDDDFARDHGRSESLADLRARIRADLERQANERAEAAVRESIINQLLSRHTFEVPESLVARRSDAMLASLDVRLPEGVEQDRALDGLRQQLRPRAERDVRAELILDALAEREGFSVVDDALNAEVDAMAAREGQAPERVRAFYDRPEARAALRARMIRQRALEHVLSAAKIVPVPVTEEVAREK